MRPPPNRREVTTKELRWGIEHVPRVPEPAIARVLDAHCSFERHEMGVVEKLLTVGLLLPQVAHTPQGDTLWRRTRGAQGRRNLNP